LTVVFIAAERGLLGTKSYYTSTVWCRTTRTCSSCDAKCTYL